jgi:outer membrane murein-binding lipoprotein Lpp
MKRFSSRAVFAAGAILSSSLLLAGCGNDTNVDKFGGDLNFSSKSAADADVYGVEETSASAIGRARAEVTYTSIKDRSGTLSMEVPQTWKDVNGAPAGPFSAALAASPDFDGYDSGWEVPGAAVGVSQTLGKQVASAAVPEIELPTAFASVSPRGALREDCDPDVQTWILGEGGSESYFNQTLGRFVDFGLVDAYSNCGGNGAAFIDFGALSKDRTLFIYGQFTAVSEDDIEPIRHILATLDIASGSAPTPAPGTTGPDFVLP